MPVDLRVVKQLTWALKAGVEVLLALVPVAFEDVAATLGEDDERTAVADRNRSHELLFTQVPEFAAAWVVGLAAAVPRSSACTTRNAPVVASARDSEPRKRTLCSRNHTRSRSGPRGRSRSRVNTSRGSRASRSSGSDETPRLPWFSSS